jgi:DNA-binding SARP family transcriptional activator/tetratricopeptide (TPR) repeat protein
VRFSVLGALELSRDDEVVAVTRPKSRALLALLLVRANRVVTPHELSDELWLGKPPATAASALRVHLTHLRHLVASKASSAGPIETTASGYRLRVGADDVDALRFEAAHHNAKEASRAGSVREVIELLDPALRQWRGDAYADVRDFPSTAAEAARLEEMRLSAIELLADAYMGVGGAEDAAELLGPPTLAHRLRESLTERLMLALYRMNRAPEALRVCSRLRQALDEELGVAPSDSIRALEEAIVLQRPHPPPTSRARTSEHTTVRAAMPIVGRRAELAAIGRVMAHVEAAGPCLVHIAGPAGIGKTTVARLAAGQASDAGATVMFGVCDPEPSNQFEPFSQIVRSALRRVPTEDLVSPVMSDLVHVVPDLGHRLPSFAPAPDVSTGRHRLFAATTELLAHATLQPLVLILEDLHWATRDALALLRHLQRELPASTTMLVTFRSDEHSADDTPQFTDQLHLGVPRLSIVLDGLDVPEIKSLLELAVDETVRSRFLQRVEELQALTGGNPLFIREVLETSFGADDANADLNLIAPDGVRSLVNIRLRALPLIERSTLQAAAVIGRQFSLALLGTATQQADAELIEVLEQALRAQLIVETNDCDVFEFRHPLIRNAIYAGISASRRARLHLAVVDALRAVAGGDDLASAGEVAYHATQAHPLLDTAAVARWARRAGDEARTRLAYEDAVRWYSYASELIPDTQWTPTERADLLLSLGEALEATGRRTEARDVLVRAADHARAAAAQDLLARIAVAATPRYVTLDDFTATQLALVDEALTYDSHSPGALVALLSSASAGRYYDAGDEPYATRAYELASSSGEPEVRALGLLTYHRWLTHDPAAIVKRLSLSRQLHDICRANSLDHLVGRAGRTLLIDLLGAGRVEEFDPELERFAHRAQRQFVPADLYWAQAFRATRQLLIDPNAEAESLIAAAYTLGNHLEQSEAIGTYILQTFALRFQQERIHEVVPVLRAPAPDQPRMRAGLALATAALATAGRSDDARQTLDEIVNETEIRLDNDNLWLGAIALLSAGACLVGSTEQRAILEQALRPYATNWCMFGAAAAVFGTGHHWLGKLAARDGRDIDAARHFAQAAELSDAIGATYWRDLALNEIDSSRHNDLVQGPTR